jgi:hypothetical protein
VPRVQPHLSQELPREGGQRLLKLLRRVHGTVRLFFKFAHTTICKIIFESLPMEL